MTSAVTWNLAVAAAGSLIVWLSCRRLEIASQRIAGYYCIPEAVKGAVITAVASSFPELSSVVIATLVHGDFELGVAAIVGSAIFNILVIPSLAVIFGGSLAADRAVIYKDALFYMVAIVTLMLAFSLAVVYFPLPGDGLHGTVTRGLALVPLALYGVYLFIQYHDTKDARESPMQNADTRIVREWLMLLACMGAVALGVELLVRSALNLGTILGTPSFLWGLTVVAAGTSLPDLLISIRTARIGQSVTSLSNVLGSNTFDLLVAVPFGVLLAGQMVIDFSRVAPMMGCLSLATIVMFVCMRRKLTLYHGEAIFMLILYVGFVSWMALESFKLISVLGVAL